MATEAIDGRALLLRIKEGDLDSEDVGDFIDAHLGGEDVTEEHLPELDGVAAMFLSETPEVSGGRPIDLWRAVMVTGDPEAWAAHPVGADGIGESWSRSIDGAAPYGGGLQAGARRIIHGRVVPSDVDWAATAIMNAIKPEQAERRLLATACVEVVAILDGAHGELACPSRGESFPVRSDAASSYAAGP